MFLSTCGIEVARTRSPLNNWALYQNTHNWQRALQLLEALNAEKAFLKQGKTVTQFFEAFDYGTSAMTLRGQANKYGYWEDGTEMKTPGVSGVHCDTRDLFSKTSFFWKKH